jgi:polar amino acid transport system substrate-binding protein
MGSQWATTRSAISLIAVTLLVAAAFLSAVGDTHAGAIQVPAKGASKTIDQIREEGELRAGVAVSAPWLAQHPQTGEWFGPAREIGDRITQLLGVRLKLIPTKFDVVVAGLQGRHFDLALAPLYATERRLKVVDFVTYTEPGTCYLVLKDNNKVNTLDDLNQPSVVIGTWTGGGTEQMVMAKYPKAKFDSKPYMVTGGERTEDLLSRRIDVAPTDSPLAVKYAQEYANEMKIIPGGLQGCLKNPDSRKPLGMALNYGDPEFKKFLQAIVADMQEQINASIVKYSSPEYLRFQQ